MNELQVPAPGRVCACGATMRRARSGSLRWRCPKCRAVSSPDPYLASMRDGAPTLPGMERMTRWVLRFDGYPPGPNDSMPLRERLTSKVYWRQAAAERIRIQQIPKLGRVKLSAVFYRRALGVADEDNDRARLKPIVDGLVRAGVLPKDTRVFVVWGDVTEERGPDGLALVIERADP